MTILSLLEQARAQHPGINDEHLVVSIAAELVELLDLEPPVSPEMLASYQGIARIERTVLDWAGCLIDEHGELVIRVRSSDSAGRQRFTILHEIAHTFLPGYEHSTQYRCTPMSTRSRDRNEVLCDLAASELLMPTRFMQRVVREASFGLDAVCDLAEICDASLEAAARRFVASWPEPSLFIKMEVTTKPSDRTGEPRLRVTSSLAQGAWPYLPHHKSVPDSHILNDCVEGADVNCVANIDDLARQRIGPVELHARHYPYVSSEGELSDRVLVIARRAVKENDDG